VTGGDGYEPCAPLAPGAQECTLQYFADKGIADQVVPPVITMKDFEKVLERARPTVSTKDLEVGGWGCGDELARGGGVFAHVVKCVG
jgi:vacuolar protein-sorting-associated protein 4